MLVAACIFLGLILIVLLIASSMPNGFMIEKTIVINKPVEDVMNRIGDLNYYKQWNPWQQMDPDAKSDITGTPKTPGHKYAWQGKKVGIGSLTLREISHQHIHFDLQFLKPWKTEGKDHWLFESQGNNETKVTWQNSGALPWPIARLMGRLITRNLNHQFDKGLNNLKTMCEGS